MGLLITGQYLTLMSTVTDLRSADAVSGPTCRYLVGKDTRYLYLYLLIICPKVHTNITSSAAQIRVLLL